MPKPSTTRRLAIWILLLPAVAVAQPLTPSGHAITNSLCAGVGCNTTCAAGRGVLQPELQLCGSALTLSCNGTACDFDLTATFDSILCEAAGCIAESAVDLSGYTAGSVIFSDGTGLAENNANFFWADGTIRLGIGTASPVSNLHIYLSGQPKFSWTDARGAVNDTTMGFLLDAGISLSKRSLVLQALTDAGAFQANLVTFTDDGLVGIGTTAPAEELQVTVAADNAGRMRFTESATGDTWDIGGGAGDSFLIFDPADAAEFTLTASGQLTIAGRMGVADATPDYNFEVNGTAGNGFVGVTSATDGDIFEIDALGNVGIGNAAPSVKLDAEGTIEGDTIRCETGRCIPGDDVDLATTTVSGTVVLSTDREATAGEVIQANDGRLAAATTIATGIVELATDREAAANVVVQGNDGRLAAATTTATGIVELATNGEAAANVVVQGNDSRLSLASSMSGFTFLVFGSACPTGWTQVTTLTNRYARITSGAGGGSGGSWLSATDSHTLTIAEMPAHDHSINVSSVSGTAARHPELGIPATGNFVSSSSTINDTGGGGGHTHTITMNAASIEYITVILCTAP